MFRLTPNLDRFAYGLPDPQDAPTIAECDDCGREIYEGEALYSRGFWDSGVYCEECEAECQEEYEEEAEE